MQALTYIKGVAWPAAHHRHNPPPAGGRPPPAVAGRRIPAAFQKIFKNRRPFKTSFRTRF